MRQTLRVVAAGAFEAGDETCSDYLDHPITTMGTGQAGQAPVDLARTGGIEEGYLSIKHQLHLHMT